ncbi:MAG: YaeQ family protein, partial [Deltaproteobacteria bacterium]|nr:YaeQ family protein [Deltaproteobacteria bacterium]
MAAFTTWNFELEISDLDREIYASQHVSVAQHPSETVERLVARMLAYALEYTVGIRFSGDLSSGDEPAAWVHDLTGALMTWIEVGAPSPERVHRATKAADRVAIYNHKEMEPWLSELRQFKVYSPAKLWILP